MDPQAVDEDHRFFHRDISPSDKIYCVHVARFAIYWQPSSVADDTRIPSDEGRQALLMTSEHALDTPLDRPGPAAAGGRAGSEASPGASRCRAARLAVPRLEQIARYYEYFIDRGLRWLWTRRAVALHHEVQQVIRGNPPEFCHLDISLTPRRLDDAAHALRVNSRRAAIAVNSRRSPMRLYR
jgi:hypothetical protein